MGTATSSSKNATPTANKQLSRQQSSGEEANQPTRGHGQTMLRAKPDSIEETTSPSVSSSSFCELDISSIESNTEVTDSDDSSDDDANSVDEARFEAARQKYEVLADCAALKKLAVDYQHPELPVKGSGNATRCFFNEEADEDEDYANTRAQVLADAAAFKKLAVDYLHPELPLGTSGSNTARCYFDRASAPQHDAEREQILADCAALKQLAVAYAHVEIPVTTNGDSGRCYFEEEAEEEEVDEETRLQILADCAALKKLAVDYAHPEIPVQNGLQSRCFFDRASAPQADGDREEILNECAALKQLAVDYAHPELPVPNGVPSSNFFNRVNAPEEEDEDEEDERDEILADCAALKQLAVDYAHPEVPITSNGSTARCFFDRASATEVDAERDEILADCAALKQLAVAYSHVEIPVNTNGNCGRCYFERASKEVTYLTEIKGVIDDDLSEAEMRAEILKDASALKELAVAYSHPEISLSHTASNVSRCFFSPSGFSTAESLARESVLSDARELGSLARAYAKTAGGIVSSGRARNYFDRASAPNHSEHIVATRARSDSAQSSAQNSPRRQRELSDQFALDMDFGSALGKSGMSFEAFVGHGVDTQYETPEEDDEEDDAGDKNGGGKMSRSPSSILLFEQAQLAEGEA